MLDFPDERRFDFKQTGNKSTRVKSLIKLIKSHVIRAGSHKKKALSNTRFLPFDPYELFDRLNLLLQEKQAGNNCNIINEDFVAMADKLLEYKCLSAKQHELLLLNCLD